MYPSSVFQLSSLTKELYLSQLQHGVIYRDYTEVHSFLCIYQGTEIYGWFSMQNFTIYLFTNDVQAQ